MVFLEQTLELGLNFGASYGPRFSTAIATQSDGQEQRRAMWSQPLIVANLAGRAVDKIELDYLLDFHASVKGSAYGFRLRDWSDYKSGLTAIGTGNGTTQTWQLIKRYTVGSYTTTRPITKPVAGSLTLYLNGVATATGWSLNTTTGVLTTNLTGAIAVDFEFDVPVRFAEDQIKFTFNAADPFDATRRIFTLDALTCTEIRLEPTIYPAIEPLPTSMPLFNLGYDYGTNGGPQFDTGIASTASEFEARIPYLDSPKGSWNIGDRTLERAQVAYFLAFYRLCRGMAVPFSFKDWQDETVKSTRFAEDRISLQFNAYRPHDQQVIFYLGGLAIGETELALSIPCTPSSSNYSDSFNSSFNWTLQQVDYTGSNNSGNSSVSTQYLASGGNTGGCVQIRLDYGNVPASPASGIRGYWLSRLSYTPTSEDEIITVNFSVDRIGIDKTTNVQYASAAYFYTSIDGNITIYEASGSYSGWTTITLNNQSISSFAVKTPIYFGFAHGAGTNTVDATEPKFQVIGIDNYNVTVNIGCP